MPAVLVAGGCLFALDQILPRYLVAAVLIAPFALAAHCAAGASLGSLVMAVAVLGTVLGGLWENCEICSGRSFLLLLGRWSGE